MMVFTRESTEKMLQQGGSASWRLNEKRAQRYSYLICVRNNPGNRDGIEPNGQAFLVAKIKDIAWSPDPQYPGRYIITFDQYAETQIDNVWQGWRNPVFYDVEPNDLGLDISELDFSKNMVKTDKNNFSQPYRETTSGLTINEARQGLAKTFSVDIDAIEITIRV